LKANEKFMHQTSESLVRKSLETDGLMEMVHETNIPYTTLVIANLLDVPPEDHEAICQIFRDNVFRNMEQSPEPDGSVTSLVALAAYFTAYIGEKAENPADDLTSELATSIYPDGSEPPIGERIRLATMLFAAGQDTTAKLLGNAMRYIIENPALQDSLRGDLSLVPAFLEEMLRIEGSTKVTARLARKPAQIGEFTVPAGTRVLVSLAGANRDPRRWPDPESFAMERPRIKEHLAFSRGAHACVCAQLARTESRILIEHFLRMTRKIDYDPTFHGPAGARRVQYEPNFILRGISELHLKLTPA
jgi:cytochrome P450